MADKIQIRRDTAANWATQNPVLSQGELGAETDTSKIKMGDASSTWNQLGYLIDTGSYATSSQLQTAVSDLVDSAPGALDTLNELAAALGDDPDFATTVTNAIATKATTSTLSAVATSGDYTDLSNRPTIPTALTDVGVTDGSNGQVLSTDGSGTFTFVDSYDDADVSSYLANNGYGTSSSIVASIVDSAPGALDTLNELASALGDDANFSTTVTNSLALKANTADLNAVATSGAYADLSGTPTIPSDLTDVGITDGTIGQVLTTNGSGTFTFADAAAGGGGGSFEAVASGALANGDKVLVNADGTVSVVAPIPNPAGLGTSVSYSASQTINDSVAVYDSNSNKVVIIYRDYDVEAAYGVVGTVNGSSISFGSSTSFINNTITNMAVTFDSNSNKVVVSFKDNGNNSYGSAIVGTVSGTSISFGSKVVYNSSTISRNAITFDSNSNKAVIAFIDSSAIKTIVGDVSGTSISFGSAVTLDSSNSANPSLVFDSNANKVVAAWGDTSSSNSPIEVAVGTVSGTSISFGSAVTMDTGYYMYNGLPENGGALAFDSNLNKVVVFYSWNDNGTDRGASKVGTVSGTSISFGSRAIFETDVNPGNAKPKATFDASLNKVVAVYRHEDRLRTVVGTVSGTSISFTSPETSLLSGSPSVQDTVNTVFDSANNKLILSYINSTGNIYVPYAAVYQAAAGADTYDLTAENYVGISDAAYSDGATATIQSAGAVDDAQSGLTAGQAYFLNKDGTLSTTAGDPSVFAGTALSATQLMIGKSPEIVSYSDSDVASYLSSNDYATATATIATITDSAPGTLDTLNELAAALGDDANFSTTVTNSIALKANSADLSAVATSGAYADLSGTPSLSAVATSGAYADISGTPSIPSALTDIGITDGTNGQVLTTNGSGAFTFADAASPYGDSNVASYLASAVIDGGSA
jgi:hypothetical protein